MTATLRIRMLGPIKVSRLGKDLSRFPSQKSLGLFTYLALHHRKQHSRESLADLFWPNSQAASARKRLRTELWLTRKFLDAEIPDPGCITVSNSNIGLNPEADIWLDVAELEESLKPFEGPGAPSGEDGHRLERAAALYRGDLLEGRYDDWCLEAREHLKTRFVNALERWMALCRKLGRNRSAIECGRLILRQDPLAEPTHRRLMACYFENGDRVAALRQFQRCAEVLKAELDIEPMFETRHLYQQIKDHRGPERMDRLMEPRSSTTGLSAL